VHVNVVLSRTLLVGIIIGFAVTAVLLTTACSGSREFGWDVQLQEAASTAEIEALQQLLESDSRVESVGYVSREQAERQGGGDSTETINGVEIVTHADGAYLSIAMRPGITEQEFRDFQRSIEGEPDFTRAAKR